MVITGTCSELHTVEGDRFNTVTWEAKEGSLRNVTVAQTVAPDVMDDFGEAGIKVGCVVVVRGAAVEVAHCDVSSPKGTGIEIEKDADVVVHHSTIHNCGVSGVSLASTKCCRVHDNDISDNLDGILVWRAGKGEFDIVDICDNKVLRNKGSGIGVHSKSRASVQRNFVESSGQSGIYFSDHSEGMVCGNWISSSGMAGVSIKSHACPTVCQNAILDGQSAGVYIRGHAEGSIKNNTILRNAKAGIGIKQHAKPHVVDNRISDGNASAICVHRTATGEVVHNILGPHKSHALWIGAQEDGLVIERNKTLNQQDFLEQVQEDIASEDLSEFQRQALLKLVSVNSERPFL